MSQFFSANDYAELYEIVFNENYPGYRPNVVEAPNGDGKLDFKKRYAHVAKKYIEAIDRLRYTEDKFYKRDGSMIQKSLVKERLKYFLNVAHKKSIEVAVDLGIPAKFWPDEQDGTLRVLEYDHESITNEHTDFDLFTLMCYRNVAKNFLYMGTVPDERSRSLNSQIHFGELMQELNADKWKATKHMVTATETPNVNQHSIVYFAMPRLDAILPSGVSVENWLNERKSRSRY